MQLNHANVNATPLSRPAPAVLDRPPHTDNMCDAWDITDAYHEAGGDLDQECKGYFDFNPNWGQCNPTLVGIEVIERGQSQFYSSDYAITVMGLETIDRLEKVYAGELNG